MYTKSTYISFLIKKKSKIIPISFLEVEDTYHTVALKLLSSFKWLREFSKSSELQWILKLDDDVLINFERLVKFVNQIRLNQNSIYCLVYERAAPFRGYSKWYMNS